MNLLRDKTLLLILWIALVVIIGIIIIVGSITGHFKISVYIAVFYSILSIQKLRATEIGAILFFGYPCVEVRPGPVPVPFGLFSIVKETSLVRQDEIPGDPEKIDKTDTDTLAPGKVFPIRVTHRANQSPQNAIDDRMTTEVRALVRYRVEKGQFIRFFQTIETLKEARRQMRDTLESEIKKQFAARTPSETLEDLGSVETKLKERLELLTDSWGIEIIDAQITDIDLGKKVNQSLRDVPAATLQKAATKISSEGKKIELINLGEGTAKARKELLMAEAAGRQALLEAEAIGTAKLAAIAQTPEGQVTLWLDTIRAGFEKSNHTIIPGGEFFSSIASISELLEKVRKVSK